MDRVPHLPDHARPAPDNRGTNMSARTPARRRAAVADPTAREFLRQADPVLAPLTDAPPAFRPLFNGRDFTGWRPMANDDHTWSVRDGVIVCTGHPN